MQTWTRKPLDQMTLSELNVEAKRLGAELRSAIDDWLHYGDSYREPMLETTKRWVSVITRGRRVAEINPLLPKRG